AHTFTVTVQKNLGAGGGFVAASGETVAASWAGAGSITGGTCGSTTTDSSGQCTVIVNSSSAGTGTLSASVTLTGSGVSLTRALGDTNAGDDAKVTKTWVDAHITVSPSSTNAVGSAHTVTVTVQKNLGAGGGFVAASGETVAESWAGAGSITGGTCGSTTTDSLGQCTVIVNSSSAGT